MRPVRPAMWSLRLLTCTKCQKQVGAGGDSRGCAQLTRAQARSARESHDWEPPPPTRTYGMPALHAFHSQTVPSVQPHHRTEVCIAAAAITHSVVGKDNGVLKPAAVKIGKQERIAQSQYAVCDTTQFANFSHNSEADC